MSNCLGCYQNLKEGEIDYHPECLSKIFGTKILPNIDFDIKQLEELATQIIKQGKTVTGVQPKLSLNVDKKKNEAPRLTIVGLHGDYILKPPSKEYSELPENEDVSMHLAELLKIKTAKHSLIRLKSEELAYLTKRFDRVKGEKLAVEDFCQLSENVTEHKYRGSIEKIGKLIYIHTSNKGFEAQRLFELVLFCYLIGNADMHLKNFSLIENSLGEYELSPAYDLVNTSIVLLDDKEESALTINGKKNKLQKVDFDELATSLKIIPKSLDAIYHKFNQILPTWITCIEKSFLSKKSKEAYIAVLKQRHQAIFSS